MKTHPSLQTGVSPHPKQRPDRDRVIKGADSEPRQQSLLPPAAALPSTAGPQACELTSMLTRPDLFGSAAPHRMRPDCLRWLRSRTNEGRVKCGQARLDAFIDDVLSDDLTFESHFVLPGRQDTRAGPSPHANTGPVTPFQLATELAWKLSIGPNTRPDEAAVMHAAGLFYGCGYFLAAHPNRVATRQGQKVTLFEVRRARWLVLARPLSRLCEDLPSEGTLLTSLLLGWDAARTCREDAGIDPTSAHLQRQHARLLTSLHLAADTISCLWHPMVRWHTPLRANGRGNP
jgi:hypothetical protein